MSWMRPSVRNTKKGLRNQLIRVRERLYKRIENEEFVRCDTDSVLDRCLFGNFEYTRMVIEDETDEKKDFKAWFRRMDVTGEMKYETTEMIDLEAWLPCATCRYGANDVCWSWECVDFNEYERRIE